MLNDLLTGKQSTEPSGDAPYREAGAVPMAQRTCPSCQTTFAAPAIALPGPCEACAITAASQAHAARQRGARRDARLIRWGLVVVLGVGAAIFRYGMREAQRDDAARAAGYHGYAAYEAEQRALERQPTDPYSREVQALADQMCRCADLACAQGVEAQYLRLLQNSAPVGDAARASAEWHAARLVECQQRLDPAP